MLAIIILSKTDAYINRLLASMEKSQFDFIKKASVIVGDNGLSEATRTLHHKVKYITIPEPFVFAKAVNLCVAAAPKKSDILVMNDDTEIMTPKFVDKLEAALADPRSEPYGVLSPKITGGAGNTDMMKEIAEGDFVQTQKPVCFIAALIRRKVWNQVGGLDERYTGYGWEDTDYCYDKETQIVTAAGVKFIKDVTKADEVLTLRDDGVMEYRHPERLISRFEEKLLHFRTQRLDLMVTPDQELLVGYKRKERGKYKDLDFMKASAIAEVLSRKEYRQDRYFVKKNGGTWVGERPDVVHVGLELKEEINIGRLPGKFSYLVHSEKVAMEPHLFAEFMAWFLAEGSIQDKLWIKISQSREKNAENYERICELFTQLNLEPRRWSEGIGIKHPCLANALSQFGHSHEKFIPDAISLLAPEYLDIFLQTYARADGTFKENGFALYTSSERMRDGLVELLLKTGRAFSFSLQGGGETKFLNGSYDCRPVWHIQTYNNNPNALLQKPKEIDYNDYVYDITVPNHRIYVIRNGKGCWSSNCRQVVESGWKLGLFGTVTVKHGFEDQAGPSMSGTFGREFGHQIHTQKYLESKQIFEDKWGTGPQLGTYEAEPVEMKTTEGIAPDVAPPTGSTPPDFKLTEPHEFDALPGSELPEPPVQVDSDQVVSQTSAMSDLPREAIEGLAPAPQEAIAHAFETDIEQDIGLLWAITKLARPEVAIELGTRRGISTRTLAHAIKSNGGGRLITIDPDPACAQYLSGIDCEFKAIKGEDYIPSLPPEERAMKVNLIFIDTDPHSFSQTVMWLDEFVTPLLAKGGVVLFHDVRHEPKQQPCIDCIQGNHDIQVSRAIQEWLENKPGWKWVEYPKLDKEYRWTQGGLGALWAPVEEISWSAKEDWAVTAEGGKELPPGHSMEQETRLVHKLGSRRTEV